MDDFFQAYVRGDEVVNQVTDSLFNIIKYNNPNYTSGGPNLYLRWYPQQQGDIRLGPSRFGINCHRFNLLLGKLLENVSEEIAR